MNKLKIAIAGTFRPIFQGDMKGVLDESIRKLSMLSIELDFDFIPITKGMETIEDAYSVKKQLDEEGADFILLQNSSFADGSMLMPFLDSKANLGIWAVPEPSDSGPLPLNSLCATNLYMSIPGRYAKDYNKSIKWFFGSPSDPEFVLRFVITVNALKAIKSLSQTKILMLGDIAPGFYNLTSDAVKIKEIFNVDIIKVELDELYDEYKSVENINRDNKINEIISQSSDVKTSKEAINKSAILEDALQNLVSRYDVKAVGIQCWPDIPQKLGVMVCSTVGRLIENGVMMACEGDIMGSLSMLVLEYISGNKPMLMDLSSWDKKNDSVYAWHCGNIPKSWYNEDGFVLENHFNRKTIGMVRNGYLKDCKVTTLRLFENDRTALIAGGSFYQKDLPRYKGVGGWMKDLQINGESVSGYDFMNTILVNKVQHHLAYINTDITDVLNEFCAWLNIKPLSNLSYKNYLQLPQ